MSLDIHISPNRNKAEREHRSFWLEERSHASLIRSVDRTAAQLKLMSRIRDYYADAEFQASELDELTTELRFLEKQESNEGVLEVIRGLMAVCQNASQKKANLYFFCD